MALDYDSWKTMSPEDDYIHRQEMAGKEYVCDCEHCCNPLFSDDEVITDVQDRTLYCSEDCFEEHMREYRMEMIVLPSRRMYRRGKY